MLTINYQRTQTGLTIGMFTTTDSRDSQIGTRRSWEITAARLWVFRWIFVSETIGYVNARSEAEAIAKAAERWPSETKIIAFSKDDAD